jgi:hypothetical protein
MRLRSYLVYNRLAVMIPDNSGQAYLCSNAPLCQGTKILLLGSIVSSIRFGWGQHQMALTNQVRKRLAVSSRETRRTAKFGPEVHF